METDTCAFHYPTVTLKAKETGSYTIMTTIRDEGGTEKTKATTVNVVEKAEDAAILEKGSVDYGHSLEYTIPDAGSGAVYEVYSKMPGSTEWVQVQRYNANRSLVLRPRYIGVTTYLIRSKLSGRVTTSYYAINAAIPDLVYQELAIINQERQKVGSGALRIDTELQYVAGIRAEELVRNYDHLRPDGSDWHTIFEELGIHAPVKVGECITWGHFDPSGAVLAWMNSPEHKKVMLDNKYDRVGLGLYKKFWSQNLGG